MSKHFSVLVIGENYEELMDKYSLNNEVTPYIRHKYDDKEKIRKNIIKGYEEILKSNLPYPKDYMNSIRQTLKEIKKQTPLEFYKDFTYGLTYDEDGNAISTENPNGKWDSFTSSLNFTNPFILKELNENGEQQMVVQAKKGEIDWDMLHRNVDEIKIYERCWDLIVDKVEPNNSEIDNTILDNMSGKDNYFKTFKNKEQYINYSTSYKFNVCLDSKKWYDVDDELDSFDWCINFYDRFIKPLDGETRLTILECVVYD